MKFSIKKTGQTGLMVALCVLASACNPDEFFPIEEFLTGEDAYCYEAKDLNSCQERSDRCQPAYVEADEQSEDAGMELAFLVCIANPKPVPVDDGSTVGGTDGGSSVGGTDGGADGSATAGSTDGSATAGSTDGSATAGSTDGSSAGGSNNGSSAGGSNNGSSAGGSNNGSSAGGSTGGSTGGSDPVAEVPTLEEVLASKCQNLSSEYLWEKTETKKGKVISKTSKVKICHSTSNGSAHTIVIACPALKAHIKHKQAEDYLGACY